MSNNLDLSLLCQTTDPPECLKDYIGNTYGKLTVDGYYGYDKRFPKSLSTKKHAFYCTCNCGNTVIRRLYNVLQGRSCGCSLTEFNVKTKRTHNMSESSEFGIWRGMKRRCYNTSNHNYHLYGGRGIKVCDRWMESFENFYEDMGDRPSENHSLDRIDNNKGYYPENCKWSTKEEQRNNRRVPESNASKYYGVSYDKRKDAFRVMVKHLDKTVRLGYFDCELEAAEVYDDYVIKHNLPRNTNFENYIGDFNYE